jgi:hypothetical protein
VIAVLEDKMVETEKGLGSMPHYDISCLALTVINKSFGSSSIYFCTFPMPQ